MSDLAKSKRGGETNLREKVEGRRFAVIISPARHGGLEVRGDARRYVRRGGEFERDQSRGGEYAARRLDHETAVSERRRSQGRKTKADFARRRRNAGWP